MRTHIGSFSTLGALLLSGSAFVYGHGLTHHHQAARTAYLLAAMVLVGSLGLLGVGWRGIKVDRGFVLRGLALVWTWAALGLLWHEVQWAAPERLVTWLLMLFGTLGLSLWLTQRSFRNSLLVLYALAAAATALVYGRIESSPLYPLDNPNVAASFALLPMTLAAAYWLLGRGWAVRLLAILVLVAFGQLVIATDSKGAWLGAAVGFGLTLGLALTGRWRRLVFGLGLLAVVGCVALFLHPSRQLDLNHSMGNRLQIWEGSLQLWGEGPIALLAGHGAGSFQVLFRPYHPVENPPDVLWQASVRWPHSLPLAIGVEMGLTGVLLGLVCAALLARVVWQTLERVAYGSDRAVVAGAGGGLAAMGVHSLVSIAPHQLPVAFHAWLALALILAEAARNAKSAASSPPLPPRMQHLDFGLRLGIATGAVVLLGLGPMQVLRSESLHRQAFVLQTEEQDLAGALATLDQALEVSPWEADRTLRLRRHRIEVLLDLAQQASGSARVDWANRAYREAIDLGHERGGIAPGWGYYELLAAEAALLAQNDTRARRILERGWQRRPDEWRYYSMYLDHYDVLGPHPGLSRQMQVGLERNPEFFPLLAVEARLVTRFGASDASTKRVAARRAGMDLLTQDLLPELRVQYQAEFDRLLALGSHP